MGVYTWDGHSIEVDEDGFIQEPDQWSEDLAAALAKSEEEIEKLTPEHWKVINYLRE